MPQLNGAPFPSNGPRVSPSKSLVLKSTALVAPVVAGKVKRKFCAASKSSSSVQNSPSGPMAGLVPEQEPTTAVTAVLFTIIAAPGPPAPFNDTTGRLGGVPFVAPQSC